MEVVDEDEVRATELTDTFRSLQAQDFKVFVQGELIVRSLMWVFEIILAMRTEGFEHFAGEEDGVMVSGVATDPYRCSVCSLPALLGKGGFPLSCLGSNKKDAAI